MIINDTCYKAFETRVNDIRSINEHQNFAGFILTTPFKIGGSKFGVKKKDERNKLMPNPEDYNMYYCMSLYMQFCLCPSPYEHNLINLLRCLNEKFWVWHTADVRL